MTLEDEMAARKDALLALQRKTRDLMLDFHHDRADLCIVYNRDMADLQDEWLRERLSSADYKIKKTARVAAFEASLKEMQDRFEQKKTKMEEGQS